MRDNEVIMFQEKGLQLIGLIAVHVKFILTTDRLIVQPLYWLERTLVGAKNLSLELLEINTIDIVGFNQTLEIEYFGLKYSFIGPGTKRIKEHLSQSSQEPERVKERIFFQGRTNISLSGGLSIPGELSILKDGLQIFKLNEREGKLFPDIKLNSKWSEIEEFEFTPLNRMLTLSTKQESISIFGATAKLAHYLTQLNTKDEELYETISLFRMYQGSFLTIEGFLFLGTKHTHFIPITQLEELLGQPNLCHPNQDLCKIYIHGITENLLSLKFQKEEWTIEMPSPLLWVQYYQKSLFSLYNHYPFDFPKLPYQNHEIVFQCYACLRKYKNTKELYFGHLVLTREHLAFYPKNHKALLTFNLDEILQVEQRGTKLLLLAQKNTVEFQVPNPKTIEERIRRIINCLPPVEIREARGNQPVGKILGETNNIIILRLGTPFLESYETYIHETSKQLQLFIGKQDHAHTFTQGESLEIDLAKPQGRYRFKTELLEEFINRPDPVGRYYLKLNLPDNIYIYNKRKSFRVPFEQNITMTQITEQDASPSFKAQILNISTLGCRITTKLSLDPQQFHEDIRFEFIIFLSEKPHSVEAQLLNAQEGDSGALIMGLQFTELPSPTKEAIQTEALIVERELLRQNAESL